jgi:hypothetical protein
MCVVSNITQPWGGGTVPYTVPAMPQLPPPEPWHPKSWPLPPIEQIDPKIAQQLLDVISRLEKIDKALGLLDCKVEKRSCGDLKSRPRNELAKHRHTAFRTPVFHCP